MKNNVHNFRKIPGRLFIKLIKILSKFNHSFYMRLYIWALKKLGMDIKGRPIYIGASTSFDGEDYSRIHIGDRTVISSDVRFLTHDYSISRAIEATGRKLDREVYQLKDIRVGDNCFIGTKSILMPGCNIGNNVIIGAGSVVRGRIPDDMMAIGNPAQIIGNTKEWAMTKLKAGDYRSNAR